MWDKTSEEIVDKYGVHYSHMTGVPTTSGNKGSEKNVNYFSMKTDGENSKLVTWIKPMSNGSFGTSRLTSLAKDYEANNPGWIVVAGVNGDFFQNSGKITWEPTNNFMADGDMYRADYVGGHRKVIGISDNNEIIVGDPEISDLYLQLMSSEGEVVEQFPIASYNEAPKETGINLYTKDMIESHDLTGYTCLLYTSPSPRD